MIATNQKPYNYYTYGALNEYGQPTLSEAPVGVVKMAIYLSSQTAANDVLYEDCAYIGLTQDTDINSTYVIAYGEERLKVLYVNAQGRYKQVFLARM